MMTKQLLVFRMELSDAPYAMSIYTFSEDDLIALYGRLTKFFEDKHELYLGEINGRHSAVWFDSMDDFNKYVSIYADEVLVTAAEILMQTIDCWTLDILGIFEDQYKEHYNNG